MEITLELIVFTVLAVFTAVSAVLAVTTKRILRAATYLLFVLFLSLIHISEPTRP